MNKRYYLKNEKGQILDINDGKNSIFNLTSDFGISRSLSYSRVGNTFIKSKEEPEQLKLEGNINFIKDEAQNEENYKKYERFIRTSENLTFVNVRKEATGLVESYTDVDWAQLGKTFSNGTMLICKLVLHCKTSWYKQDNIEYVIEEAQNNAFGFPIDFENMVFGVGDKSSNNVENLGYSEAPLYLKIKGPVVNPKIEVLKNGEVTNSIELQIELEAYEELEYCTRDDNLLIRKVNTDGTYVNLFDLLDESNANNFFKIPVRSL